MEQLLPQPMQLKYRIKISSGTLQAAQLIKVEQRPSWITRWQEEKLHMRLQAPLIIVKFITLVDL